MKVRITVEEIFRYQSSIVIDQPKSMSDEELESILRQVERSCRNDCSVKDVAYELENEYGLKVLKVITGFPDSPDDSELEIIDVCDVKEN